VLDFQDVLQVGRVAVANLGDVGVEAGLERTIAGPTGNFDEGLSVRRGVGGPLRGVNGAEVIDDARCVQ